MLPTPTPRTPLTPFNVLCQHLYSGPDPVTTLFPLRGREPNTRPAVFRVRPSLTPAQVRGRTVGIVQHRTLLRNRSSTAQGLHVVDMNRLWTSILRTTYVPSPSQ